MKNINSNILGEEKLWNNILQKKRNYGSIGKEVIFYGDSYIVLSCWYLIIILGIVKSYFSIHYLNHSKKFVLFPAFRFEK